MNFWGKLNINFSKILNINKLLEKINNEFWEKINNEPYEKIWMVVVNDGFFLWGFKRALELWRQSLQDVQEDWFWAWDWRVRLKCNKMELLNSQVWYSNVIKGIWLQVPLLPPSSSNPNSLQISYKYDIFFVNHKPTLDTPIYVSTMY